MRFLVFSFLKLIFLLCCSLVLAKPIMEGETMNKSSLLTIQRVPEDWLKEKRDESNNISHVSQIWLKNETRFSKTTIPKRRSTIADTLKNKQHYSSRKPQMAFIVIEHALATYAHPGEIFGAQATVNVWNPFVEMENECSLAQMSIIFGRQGNTLTLEAGWHVLPSLYGDTKSRVYTYWTRSTGVGDEGCYNSFCNGFGKLSEIVGSPLPPSSLDGNQHQIIIQIRRGLGAHWWLHMEGNQVGYWPRGDFLHLREAGSLVQWGGKVSNTKPNNRHTKTAMGSGRFPREGFGKASYFHNLLVEGQGDLQPLPYERLNLLMTNPNCYSIAISQRNSPGSDFYYGGHGYSDTCP